MFAVLVAQDKRCGRATALVALDDFLMILVTYLTLDNGEISMVTG